MPRGLHARAKIFETRPVHHAVSSEDMSSDARDIRGIHDDGFHEIQLSGKQLVFLFMATTVVSVVIFLCGVLVGRGVRPIVPAQAATLAQAPSPDDGPPMRRLAPPGEGVGGEVKADAAHRSTSGSTSSSRPPNAGRARTGRRVSGRSGAAPAAQATAPAAQASAPPAEPARPQPVSEQTAVAGRARAHAAAREGRSAHRRQLRAAAKPARPPALVGAGCGASPARRGRRRSRAASPAKATTPTCSRRRRAGKRVLSRARGPFRITRDADKLQDRLAQEEQFKPWITLALRLGRAARARLPASSAIPRWLGGARAPGARRAARGPPRAYAPARAFLRARRGAAPTSAARVYWITDVMVTYGGLSTPVAAAVAGAAHRLPGALSRAGCLR